MTRLPNILVYFIDELRADYLGCYDHPFIQTPNIDRISAEGFTFSHAYTNCPICVPARNSYLTGRYPSYHGLTINQISEYAASIPRPATFTDVLSDHGYVHVDKVGKHHTGFTALDDGFSRYEPTPDELDASSIGADCVVIKGGASHPILGGTYPGLAEQTHAHRTVDAAIQAIESAGNEPWCIHVSINSPHAPVLPPEPYASMYTQQVKEWSSDPQPFESRAPILHEWAVFRGFDALTEAEMRSIRRSYLGMVSFVDNEIGRMEEYLRRNDLTDDLVTVFIADHGSSVGDHGLQVKGPYDTDDISRIPLVFRWPNRIKPGQYDHLVQITDFAPTLLDLLGLEPVPSDGVSLKSQLMGSEAIAHRKIYSEGTFPLIHSGIRESIRTEQYLYTRYPSLLSCELFDMATDPKQSTNVAEERPAIVSEMDVALDEWRRRHPLDDRIFCYVSEGLDYPEKTGWA